MSYHVATQSYEGPLDLLLQLVEQAELQITTVSLGDITEQYLASLQALPQLHPSELSGFMELASRLLYLKSLALLPELTPPQAAEQQAFIDDLQSYQRYRTAAGHLESLLRSSQRSWIRPVGEQLAASQLPLPNVAASDLQAAFAAALSRLPAPPTPLELEDTIELEDMMLLIRRRLQTHPELHLSQLLGELASRPNAIVAFLAILELLKQSLVALHQTISPQDIVIRRA